MIQKNSSNEKANHSNQYKVQKKMSKEINSFTARLSNAQSDNRDIFGYERDYGFEGLRIVVRLIDFL